MYDLPSSPAFRLHIIVFRDLSIVLLLRIPSLQFRKPFSVVLGSKPRTSSLTQCQQLRFRMTDKASFLFLGNIPHVISGMDSFLELLSGQSFQPTSNPDRA